MASTVMLGIKKAGGVTQGQVIYLVCSRPWFQSSTLKLIEKTRAQHGDQLGSDSHSLSGSPGDEETQARLDTLGEYNRIH